MNKEKPKVYLQEDEFDCGSAAVETILNIFGIETNYKDLMVDLGTNEKEGTDHNVILKYLEGFPQINIKYSGENTTIEDIRREVAEARMCLVMFQNGGGEDVDNLESGHYGIIVEVDDERVYLLDPSANEEWTDNLGWDDMLIKDFEKRWVDKWRDNGIEKHCRGWMVSIEPSDYSLSNFKNEDLHLILNLDKKTFPKDFWTEGVYEEALAQGQNSIKILKKGKKPIGYFYNAIYPVILPSGEKVEAGEIASVAVLEEFRGKKLGEYLFKEAIKDLKKQKAPRILIHTRTDNFPMQSLAKKCGFKINGQIPDYYNPGEDALQMELGI